MKVFLCIALIAVTVAASAASPAASSSSGVNSQTQQELDSETQSAQGLQPVSDNNRYRKSAGYGSSSGSSYGSASIPAPPCPKNYLFSCQPNLAPVPCAAPAASYGSSGAYTAPVPTYTAPLGSNYGLPPNYNGFVPHPINQYYQY